MSRPDFVMSWRDHVGMTYTSQPTGDVAQAVTDLLASPLVVAAVTARERLARYLVNGKLLITETHHRQLTQQHADTLGPVPSPGVNQSLRLFGIPVQSVPDNGQPVDVGNNQLAFRYEDRFYVVTREHFYSPPAGIGPLRVRDG